MQAATDYDSTRVPGGVEIFEALLRKYSPDALSDTTILDLGCGTGSYPKELLSAGIKHAFLIDGSQKMLEIAQQKMNKANFVNFNTKVDVTDFLLKYSFRRNKILGRFIL